MRIRPTVTISDFISTVPALSQVDSKDLQGIIGQCLNRATRAFESSTNAPEGYYSQLVENNTLFSDKTYYSNGSNFLHTHRFEELEDVTIAGDSQLERLIQRSNQIIEIPYLIRYTHTPIIVSAKWGWKNIPADVIEAIVTKAKLIFSTTPINRIGVEGVTLSEFELSPLMDTWEEITLKYRERNKFAYS